MFKEYRISDIGEVIGGGTPSTKNDEYWNGNIPWISPKDLTGYNSLYISYGKNFITDKGLKSGTRLLPKDTVLFSSRAPIGYIALAANDICTNQGFKSIVCDHSKVNPLYLYYYLKSNINYIKLFGSGATFPEISGSSMKKIKINIFKSIDYQKKVANSIYKYDELIEVNNKRIKLLEQDAEIYFRKSYESEIKNKNTSTIRLKEILSFTRGLSYSSEEIDCDEGITLVNLKNIQAYGGFRRDGNKLYNGEYKERQLVQQGDLIMGVTDMTQDRRTVGSVALVPFINGKSVISADLIKIISNINKSFLYCLFRYGNVSKYISQFANGANVLHLKPETVLKIKIQMPNEHFISSFSKIINPLLEEIELLNQKNEILVKQRDLLLPRLMNGKLEVK